MGCAQASGPGFPACYPLLGHLLYLQCNSLPTQGIIIFFILTNKTEKKLNLILICISLIISNFGFLMVAFFLQAYRKNYVCQAGNIRKREMQKEVVNVVVNFNQGFQIKQKSKCSVLCSAQHMLVDYLESTLMRKAAEKH